MEKGRIGLNAGKVWHALNEVNEISTQELSRKLSLSIEDLALAIGWLARENNIYITRKNGLGSPDKPGGLSIQLCKSEKKEFYIRYSS